MRLAVTGASGFIGRHVLERLRAEGAACVATTRSKKRLAAFAGEACRIVELDLAETGDAWARLGRPEAVLHLAWEGLPNYRSPRHLEVELPRQIRFLRGLIEAGLPSLVVTGTCFEYGLQGGRLSQAQPTHPDNPYGCAKDALRRELEALHAVRDFQLTWARLFYTYGEGQSPNSLYPSLAAAVARGDRSFPMSGGEQIRDFLPVAELAEILVSLALAGRGFGTVDVCSGQPVSVRDLVLRWICEMNAEIVPELGAYPYPDYEPMAFWGDRAPLQAILESL